MARWTSIGMNYCGFGQYLYTTTKTINRGQHGDGKLYP